MKNIFRWLPFVLATLWFVIRFLVGKFAVDFSYPDGRTFGVLTNLLFILILVFAGLIYAFRNNTSGNSPTFLQDMKAAVKMVMKYVVGVVLMMWLYYGVASDELKNHRTKSIADAVLLMDTDEELAAIREQNPLLEKESRETIQAEMTERIEFFTSLKILLPAALIGLSLTSVAYALLGVWIWRSFIRVNNG